MAGRSDIEAGKAHVRLYVRKNDLISGLSSVASTMKSWTVGIGKIFTGAFGAAGAIGTAIAGTVIVASKKFSKGIKELREEAMKLGTALPDEAKAALSVGDAWDRMTESAKKLTLTLVGALGPTITNILDTITSAIDAISDWVKANKDLLTSFEGITSAMASGNWALAAKIAIATIKVAFLDMYATITTLWGSVLGEVIGDAMGKFAAQVIGADFQGAWETAVLAMTAAWDAFAQHVIDAFTSAANAVVNVWQTATTAIANFILANQKLLKQFVDSAALAVPGSALAEHFAGMKASEAIFGPDVNPGDVGKAQAIAGQQLSKRADIVRQELEAARIAAASKAGDSAKALADATRGGAWPALAAAQEELRRLNEEARALGGRGAGGLAGPPGLDAAKLRETAAVTFSGVGLAALGQGGGATRTLTEIRDEIKKQREENKNFHRGFAWS